MALPASFLTHLQTSGYHSRSDKHSKALALAIVHDLVAHCPQIAAEATDGQLVFQWNHDLTFGHSTWNTDLAIGRPPPGTAQPVDLPGEMNRATPATVRIAVELKSVMTEHRKAIKNRKRDLEAHHQHVHDYDSACIAGGVVVINAAPTFQSPLRNTLTAHANIDRIVEHCIDEVQSINVAHGTNPVGLDANCALVVEMDNVNIAATRFRTTPPAPVLGSPIHWDAFIQRICAAYTTRF
jgi:hypothetical protein